ncbi:MAG: multidrug transporter [Candidatus Paceibacterota bacterium]|jgi:hypothetical protein
MSTVTQNKKEEVKMNIVLQLWGGIFYLLAKIFLSNAEGKENSKWRRIGWLAYLIGIPAWIIVLEQNHNWIAMTIELGGAPSMILGIIVTTQKHNYSPRIDTVVKIFVWMLIIIGIVYSIYESHGTILLTQILECGVTIGYLAGTYLLAKRNGKGWLFFAVMNVSMGILMTIQNKWIFVALQIISLYFVFKGFKKSKN